MHVSSQRHRMRPTTDTIQPAGSSWAKRVVRITTGTAAARARLTKASPTGVSGSVLTSPTGSPMAE